MIFNRDGVARLRGLFHFRQILSRRSEEPSQGHIIIAGTGRAGTTLLVQLFTALGFDTGYDLDTALNEIDPISSAGLEHCGHDLSRPYVMKSPHFASTLEVLLGRGGLRVSAAILPMRSLSSAAESRRRVHREAERRGLDPVKQPGGLWDTTRPAEQEDVLARNFYRTLYPLVRYQIATYCLEFPRFATDASYLFEILQPLWNSHGVSKVELRQALAAVVRLERIRIL